MRGGELDRGIGGRERFVLGKDDAACVRLALLSCFLLALTIVLPSRDRSRAAAHADREP
jgi:hypothetical protein